MLLMSILVMQLIGVMFIGLIYSLEFTVFLIVSMLIGSVLLSVIKWAVKLVILFSKVKLFSLMKSHFVIAFVKCIFERVRCREVGCAFLSCFL